MEGGQFRRCRFAPLAVIASYGILAAALVVPSAWAGSPAQDQYGSALPGAGNGGGSGAVGGDQGPSRGGLSPRLRAMKEGDLLRLPRSIAVRARGVTPDGARRFRLIVRGEHQQGVVGIGAIERAILAASARAAPPKKALGNGSGNDSWPGVWVLFLALPAVALASAAALLVYRRRSSPGGTVEG